MERRKSRQAASYSLFKRPSKRKPIYYVRFRDRETGHRRSALSTGCTRRDDAVRWCEGYLADEAEVELESRERAGNITLGEYAAGFWNPDGAYAQSRIAHLYTCSRGYLDVAESNTRNHIQPVWGETRIGEITPGKVDAWIVKLCRDGKLAPATVNKLLQTLRTILAQAVAEGRIAENPAAFVKPVKAQGIERGILTPEEVASLLRDTSIWDDHRHYAINLLAVTTGMRMGEVRGLCVENVKASHIEIRQSWEEGYGLKPPKYNSIRDVPVSPRVSEALGHVIAETRPYTIVFYSSAKRDRPISKSAIEKKFYEALKRIGITELERRRRGICFHTHRHFLNTLLRARGVADAKVREITGHRSLRMSERYTHFRAEDFAEVVDLQTKLLEAPT